MQSKQVKPNIKNPVLIARTSYIYDKSVTANSAPRNILTENFKTGNLTGFLIIFSELQKDVEGQQSQTTK